MWRAISEARLAVKGSLTHLYLVSSKRETGRVVPSSFGLQSKRMRCVPQPDTQTRSVCSVVSWPLEPRRLFCLHCSNNKQQHMCPPQTCPRSTTTRISVCCFRRACVHTQRERQSIFATLQQLRYFNKHPNISNVHFQNLWKMKSGENRCLYWALSFVLRSILVTGTECTDVCMYLMLAEPSPSRRAVFQNDNLLHEQLWNHCEISICK